MFCLQEFSLVATMAWLLQTAITGINLITLFFLLLRSDAVYPFVFDPDQLNGIELVGITA